MGNGNNRRRKRELKKWEQAGYEPHEMPSDVQAYRDSKIPDIKPLNEAQRRMYSALLHDNLVIAAGAAGTGKTFLAAATAADLFHQNHVKHIIMTRPTVEVGKSLGYRPGDLEEKYKPYMEPFEDTLRQRIGSSHYDSMLHKRIWPKPIQFVRGHTFHDSVVLLDEAQNISIVEMKAIMTRVGENCRLFITGDTEQSDLLREENGLHWLIRQIKERNLPYEISYFHPFDCVRSEFCKEMIDIIENEVD